MKHRLSWRIAPVLCLLAVAVPGLAQDVTCESRGGQQAECDMDTRGDVRIVRQLSDTHCEPGVNWGLYKHAVWVKDGCRAVFRNYSRAQTSGGGDSALLGACNGRANAQGALVSRVAVNPQTTELIIDYPDGRRLCMVRNDGLVESLTPLRKR